MYEYVQNIFNYLPIHNNKAESDYIEHLWNTFFELDASETIARPFCIMPFHLLFMLAIQYKALRVSQIYIEPCNLFFCGVAGRCKKELLSDQKSVFDIALINERTIPEIFQLVGLDNDGIQSIKTLIDERNNNLAHAKGGIEQKLILAKKDLEEKISSFGRKSNNRFELAINFIKEANQTEKIALQENPERIRDFLKKISSNPHLCDRALCLSLKKPWRIAQKWHSVSLGDTPAPAATGASENWRCFLDEVRTLYEQNPQDFVD